MEKQLADLNGKVNTLNFRINKTSEILSKNDRLAAERQKTLLENITEAVNSLKETMKIKLQQEAAERAHAEELEFERKRLELQQQHAQKKSETQYGANSGAVKCQNW